MANSAPFKGFLDSEPACDGENSKAVSLCFAPNSTWLTVVVIGWPRQNWEEVTQAGNVDPDHIISFLVDDVSNRYPEATVEFLDASFSTKIHSWSSQKITATKNKTGSTG